MIVEIIGLTTISTLAVYAYKYTKRAPENRNEEWFDFLPNMFPTIGLLGTFSGIAIGLWKFDTKHIEESIPSLLDGLKTAFIVSIFGVICLLVFTRRVALIRRRENQGKLSDETVAIKELTEVIKELRNDLNKNFVYIDENSNPISPANFFRDITKELGQQTIALNSFSMDLAIKIETGFERILNSEEKGVTYELQALQTEISKLANNIQAPGKSITGGAIEQLQSAMKEMVNEFKSSVSGSAKDELESLASLLGQAGKSLTEFPEKLQVMTDNLNENFTGLQEVVKSIGDNTLKSSAETTDKMKQQIEDMSEILKDKVSFIQEGQQSIVNKQSENLNLSDKLLNAFTENISKMNSMSAEVGLTLSEFKSVHQEISIATKEFKSISENINTSSNSIKIAQGDFSKYSNEFVNDNRETIAQILDSLEISSGVANEYSDKFKIIENGLENIFTQIQIGLNDYQKTIGTSLENYLGKYSDALTNTAQSLSSASKEQFEILEELSEQLSKIKSIK